MAGFFHKMGFMFFTMPLLKCVYLQASNVKLAVISSMFLTLTTAFSACAEVFSQYKLNLSTAVVC